MATARNYAPPSGFEIVATPQEEEQITANRSGAAKPLRVEVRGDAPPPPPAGFVVEQDNAPTAEAAPAPEAAPLPQTSAGGAAFRGMADPLLFNFRDEIAAAGGAAGNALGTALGMNQSTDSIGDIYKQLWTEEQRRRQADAEQHPYANALGTGAGIIGSIGGTTATALKGTTAAAQALRWAGEGSTLAQAGRGALLGAGMGAAGGLGAGSPDDRLADLPSSAGVGAAVGAAAPYVAPVIGRAVSAIGESTGLTSGINALARRAGFGSADIDAVEAEAQRLRGLGADPALIDVTPARAVDEAAQIARSRPGAGEIAQVTGEQRIAQSPERVRTQAATISPDDRRTGAVRQELVDARKMEGDRLYETARADIVPLTPEMVDVLATPEGAQAVGAAQRMETSKDVREAMNSLVKYARGPKEAAVPPELANLAPAARDAAMAQLGVKAPEAPPLTVDIVDKISRSMRSAAEVASRQGNNARAATLRNFADTLRTPAKEASEKFGRAAEKFQQNSQRIAAADLGENLLQNETDDFVENAAALSDERPSALTTRGTLEGIEESTTSSGDRHIFTEYVTPEGDRVRLGMTVDDQGRAKVNISDKNGVGVGNWDEMANSVGPSGVRDMLNAVRAQFPEITELSGTRVTGARRANPDAADTAMRLPPAPTLSSERDIARSTARTAVERAARDPRSAMQTAEQLAQDSEQRLRSSALLGPDDATNLGQRMEAEVGRVRTGQRVAPGRVSTADNRAGEVLLDAAGVMAGGPLVQARAVARLLTRMGISERTASDLMRNATDPALLDSAIAQMRQRGVNQRRIDAVTNGVRDLAARGAGGFVSADNRERRELAQ